MQIDINYKNKQGIYCIENLINNKKYIGSSKNIYQRLHRHLSELKRNIHPNNHLQNSFNKYKQNNFICYILKEVINENELTEVEQQYINLIKPKYNITTEVIRNTLSKESREKISKTLKQKYNTGQIKPTRVKEIYVYDIQGNFIKKFSSILETSRKLNLHESSLTNTLNGKYKQTKGYRFFYEKQEKLEPLKTQSNGKAERKQTKGKSLILENIKTKEKLYFNRIKDCAAYFNITYPVISYAYKRGKYKEFLILPQ